MEGEDNKITVDVRSSCQHEEGTSIMLRFIKKNTNRKSRIFRVGSKKAMIL